MSDTVDINQQRKKNKVVGPKAKRKVLITHIFLWATGKDKCLSGQAA